LCLPTEETPRDTVDTETEDEGKYINGHFCYVFVEPCFVTEIDPEIEARRKAREERRRKREQERQQR